MSRRGKPRICLRCEVNKTPLGSLYCKPCQREIAAMREVEGKK